VARGPRVRGTELDLAAFATVERDLATDWDVEDRRDIDERNARILADGPSGRRPDKSDNDLDKPEPAQMRFCRIPQSAACRGGWLWPPVERLR
jgi:hypothetical protein